MLLQQCIAQYIQFIDLKKCKITLLSGQAVRKNHFLTMADKSYDSLKENFLHEMDFISNLGVKMFIYPFIGRSKLATYCYHITYGLLFFTMTQLIITLTLICINDIDVFEIINVAPNIGVCLMILIKYGKIHDNKVLYDQINKNFRFDIWEAISDTPAHKEILHNSTWMTKIILRFEFYYTIGLVIVIDLFPRLIMVYQNNILGKEKQYLYPFDGWYPFDKIKWYDAAYIWESFMTTVVIFVFVYVNMLHMSYTRFICLELKILGSSMEGLISNEEVVKIKKRKDVDRIHCNIRQKLKFIICKHQFLDRIVSDLDEVLGDGMFLTYLFGSVFICLTIFTATVVDDLYKSMRYFSFFCSLLVEVFIQCIIGQLLIDHSNKLERAIYFADWVYADSDTKKMLLIFLMRSQKPFGLSAKGYLTMNLDTFSGVCSLSYQFFNLLRTAYSE
ncbi:putative odorant receptor 92a [Helicoverpa armigera]|uniref:putative odorant receptor 92a n=1 Tax=Helicoverpa armigera TaxID=29058 RepID=UPI0030836DC8